MENLNKLSFKTHKINEQSLFIPMEDIKQEFDIKENVKLYLFKVLYVHKYKSKTGDFICYLSSPVAGSPIIKAELPLELMYIHKIIGGYDYERPLEDNEKFIIKERMFRLVDKLNRGHNYYLVCYGYMVNTYKDDDANTKVEKGIQQFKITESFNKKIYDKKYGSYYIYTNNLDKALKLFVKSKSPKKLTDLQLENIVVELRKNLKFNKVPDKFFLDK